MSVHKKALSRLLLFLFIFSLFIPLAPGSASADGPTIERMGGRDRYATSALTAQAAYPEGSDTVIIARGDNAGDFADALAGSFLAGVLDAPLLLTQRNVLSEDIAVAIAELGAKKAIILGGDAAVGTAVENELKSLTDEVVRISGSSRHDTAVEILKYVRSLGHSFDSVYVANGHSPADSLIAGAKAFQSSTPLLLTRQNRLPAETQSALKAAGIKEITVVGGSAVVGGQVLSALRDIVGNSSVTVISGSDRYHTSTHFAVSEFAAGTDFLLVNGISMVDAISAAVLGQPIVYTRHDRVPPEVQRFIDARLDHNPTITIMGGVGAVSGLVEGYVGVDAVSGDFVNTLVLGLDDHPMADTIMIVSYNKSTYESVIISVPRDTYIDFQQWAPHNSGQNHLAFASYYGSNGGRNMQAGGRLTVRTLERLLNIPIHHYGALDFEGFKNLVDKIGGVEIYVPEELAQRLPTGWQVLNGEQALIYSRYRVYDSERIVRNQDMLRAILTQLRSLNYLEQMDVLDQMENQFHTSMSDWDMLDLALVLNYSDPSATEAVVLPSERSLKYQAAIGQNVWYQLLDREQSDLILKDIGLK